ncbi:MAG: hypothetical protein QOH88_2335 [Verrucomicrobiota bacterium]|jgi:hypothetical protein
MKRAFAMFVLTPGEQRLVIFVMLALVLGVWIKHHRDMSLNDRPKSGAETSLASPTPNER